MQKEVPGNGQLPLQAEAVLESLSQMKFQENGSKLKTGFVLDPHT